MSFYVTPNMGLSVPIVGSEPGPNYANDINNSLGRIDAHDHTAGKGVLITPAAISINSTLSFGGNSASNLYTAIFQSQGSALTGTNFLSFIGGNLYVNDGSGNQIAITNAGGVAGSPGSIGSLTSPAAATYNSGSSTFLWTSNTLTPAAMDNGAITIRQTGLASANGITIQSPNSLASAYSFTLPSAMTAINPSYLTSDASGNLSFSSANNVANARTRTVSVASSGVAGAIVQSASCTLSSASSSFVAITGCTVTLTTTGRPVWVGFVPDSAGGNGNIGATASSGLIEGAFEILNGASSIGTFVISASSASVISGPCGSVFTVDTSVNGSSGANTWSANMKVISGTGVNVTGITLLAYEL